MLPLLSSHINVPPDNVLPVPTSPVPLKQSGTSEKCGVITNAYFQSNFNLTINSVISHFCYLPHFWVCWYWDMKYEWVMDLRLIKNTSQRFYHLHTAFYKLEHYQSSMVLFFVICLSLALANMITFPDDITLLYGKNRRLCWTTLCFLVFWRSTLPFGLSLNTAYYSDEMVLVSSNARAGYHLKD